MGRSQAVAKCALAFGAPHDPVDLIGAGVVLDQAGQEMSIIGIVHAQRFGIASVQIPLLNFLDAGQVGAKDILQPADDFHAPLFRRGQNLGQNIQIAVIGGAKVLEDGVLVVLRMGRSEISAVEI